MESYDGDSGDCVESIKILTTLYNFLDCHEAKASRNDDSTPTVFARLCKKPKQSIETIHLQKNAESLKSTQIFFTESQVGDSIESLKDSSDFIESTKMDLQVWVSCYATHATRLRLSQ